MELLGLEQLTTQPQIIYIPFCLVFVIWHCLLQYLQIGTQTNNMPGLSLRRTWDGSPTERANIIYIPSMSYDLISALETATTKIVPCHRTTI